MQSGLFRTVFILTQVSFILTPGRGLGAAAARQVEKPAAPAAPALGATTRVSVASDGSQGNGGSSKSSISANGRYVAFDSDATNLVNGDTNNAGDVFVHDRQTGLTERISVASDGSQSNNDSWYPFISADGRYVAFDSPASNLVSGDTNGQRDVFVHDQQTGSTERVSVASDGNQGNGGTYFRPSISADGRFVAFGSSSSNLVDGDADGANDIYVHDRQTGVTQLVSVASDGTNSNFDCYFLSISADGRFVAFDSSASNLVSGDTNSAEDVFVHDRQTGVTERVSVASDGSQGDSESYGPSISADGRYVAFYSWASTLVPGFDWQNVFVHDRQTGNTQPVSVSSDGSQADDMSFWPSISADGHYVAFASKASILVSGDTNGAWDIFVYDRHTGNTTRVSVVGDSSQGNNDSSYPFISADGRFVSFESGASNLVSGDTNGYLDIFVHDRGLGSGGYTIYLPISQNQP